MNEKTIYALGFFDGVHLGHQALLRVCRELAGDTGGKAGVVTFTSHPDTLVSGKTPGLINTHADRTLLLRQYGAERIVALPFDRTLMNMPWQDFFRLLLEEYDACGIVCGEDFRFGKGGEGTAALLQQACREENISCRVVPAQKQEGITVSSTHIRTFLQAGDMEAAVRFLGHPHILSGTVVAGRGLGHTIGIPTANMLLSEELVQPKLGVYAGCVAVDGVTYPAVTNIGSRPTVGGHQVRAESWLLDFEGDLYGKAICLQLYAFLRPEQKFDSLEALQTEIRKNAVQTRKILEK